MDHERYFVNTALDSPPMPDPSGHNKTSPEKWDWSSPEEWDWSRRGSLSTQEAFSRQDSTVSTQGTWTRQSSVEDDHFLPVMDDSAVPPPPSSTFVPFVRDAPYPWHQGGARPKWSPGVSMRANDGARPRIGSLPDHVAELRQPAGAAERKTDCEEIVPPAGCVPVVLGGVSLLPPLVVSSPVFLNVFALVPNAYLPTGSAGAMFNNTSWGVGAVHTAVEVYGTEWYFSYTPVQGSTGVCKSVKPRRESLNYQYSLSCGETLLYQWEVLNLIENRLKPAWQSTEYHIIGCNCNHFAREFLSALGVQAPSLPTLIEDVTSRLSSLSTL